MLTLLLLVVAQTPEPDFIGAVTATRGKVVVVRDGQSYRAGRGAGITNGDTILTGANGGTSFFIYEEMVVYLGDNSRATLHQDAGQWRLHLAQGEARVTVGDAGALTAETRHGQARLERGILRLAAEEHQSRFAVEHGSALMTTREGRPSPLDSESELHVSSHGAVRHSRSEKSGPWMIRAGDYQFASAAAAVPRPLVPGHRHYGDCPWCPVEEQPRRIDDREPLEDVERDEPEDVPTPAERGPADDIAAGQATDAAGTNLTPTGGIGAFALGGLSGTTAVAASGGLFSDANQQTLQGQLTTRYQDLPAGSPFPGNIHLVTAENRYQFDDVRLLPSEQATIFPGNEPAYWSIGTGPAPTSQVVTDFLTGTDPVPTTIDVPRFDAYLVRLDQFGVPDAGLDPQAAKASDIGLAGLLGPTPAAPTIVGAAPLQDERAEFNGRATFALGEFRLTPDNDSLELAIRRSDQDRLIVKDPGGNDAQDLVTVNPQVAAFDDVADPRFLPQVPAVKVPQDGAFDQRPNRFANLNLLRRAATTTLMADQLHDYARRTGQTRFVIQETDGTRRILDISGYQRP